MVKTKGIIFDMDNTLLQSSIDFPKMKRQVVELLTANDIINQEVRLQEHTVATLMELAKGHKKFTESLQTEVWQMIAELEYEGMKHAALEPNALEIVQYLSRMNVILTVATNNAKKAAEAALSRTGIAHYFHEIVGREQMTELKPSSSGLLRIMNSYQQLKNDEWVMIGDSWIDAQAALGCKVPFIAYKGNILELQRRGIPFISQIDDLNELLRFVNE